MPHLSFQLNSYAKVSLLPSQIKAQAEAEAPGLSRDMELYLLMCPLSITLAFRALHVPPSNPQTLQAESEGLTLLSRGWAPSMSNGQFS